MDDFITLRQLQGCLGGEECLTAVVTHTPSSSSSASTPPASLPSTQHWVLLPPEAMLKARLTAGAYVMVALTRSPSIDDNSSHGTRGMGLPASSGRLLSPAEQQVAAQPGSRRKKQDVEASHGGNTTSSVNSPVASPQQQPQMHNSVAVTTSFATASGPALNPDSCLIQGLLQLQQQQQQESPCTADDNTNVLLPDIGQYVVCAAAWPGGSKMSRGTIALSPSVNDMMLCCEVATSSSSSSTTKVPLEGRTVAVFGVGSGTSGTPNSKGMIMSETTVPEPCMELVLQACTASETMSPVRGAAGGQAAPSLSSPTPAIQGSSGGGGNKGGSSSPAAQQQHHISNSGSGVRPSTVAGRQAAAGAGRSWPLRLLSHLTSSSSSSSSTSSLAPLSAAQRALISNIMLKHLDGQVLLPGNPVPIPLLGVTLLCRCLLTTAAGSTALFTAPASGATSSSLSSSPSPASNHKTVIIRTVKIQAGLTKLTLLLPGEQCDLILDGSPGGLSSSLSSTSKATCGNGVRSGATGQESYFESRSGKLSSQQVQVQLAAVKAAAERAVGGSGVEAAQAAAERSFLAGLAATNSLKGREPVGQEGMSSPPVPSGGFNTLGGVSNHVQALRQLVTLPLRAPHLFNAYKIRPPRGVLLWGPPGSGKTMLARAAASDAGATLFLINGPDIVSEYYGESEAGLRGVFAAARALAPSVIFIDEVDALAPARGGGGGLSTAAGGGSSGGEAGSMAGRIVTVLLTLMDGVTPAGATSSTGSTVSGDGVVVLAATNRPDALDSALRRPGRFERELEIGVPGPAARLDILKSRLQNIKHQLTESEIKALADAAHGFVGADLAQLVDEATLSALRRVIAGRGGMNNSSLDHVSESSPKEKLPESQQQGLCVQLKDFREAETRVRPSAMREVAVEVPKVHWNDVGGLEDVKERLKEVVEWPSRHPDALSRLGVSPPRGLLLYGPPGCSKTLLARAVATEAGLNFFSIKGGELFSKYVGESEKAVASLFARARATAPSVVFFDEIDALAASRSQPGGVGSSSSSSGDRVLTQLLMELDGLQARSHVIVLAATNRPDCVDAALLRPGRFDRLLYVPPPNKEGRASILRVHLRGTPLDQDVDIAQLAECTADMTGADLSALCREASLAALEEDIGCKQVSMHHFTAALSLVTSSSAASEEMQRIYERFKAPGQL